MVFKLCFISLLCVKGIKFVAVLIIKLFAAEQSTGLLKRKICKVSCQELKMSRP